MAKRNGYLDIVKGAATLMVLTTHYKWTGEQRLNLLFPYWISMAVPLFMLVTGYLSAASFERGGIDSVKKAYSIKPLLKKLLRYSLPFIYMYIIEITILIIKDKGLSVGDVLLNFFIGGFGVHGTYYFPVIIQITLLFPLIFFVVKNKKWGLPACFVINLALEILKTVFEMQGATYRLLAFRYIFVVAAGAYIYLYGKAVKYEAWVVSAVLGALYIWLVNYSGYTPKIFIFWEDTTMLSTLFIAPIFAAFIDRKVNFAPLELVGRACYHIFLAQIIVYNYIAPYLYKALHGKALEFVLCVGAGLTLGLLYYFLYDKIKKAKGFFRVRI